MEPAAVPLTALLERGWWTTPPSVPQAVGFWVATIVGGLIAKGFLRRVAFRLRCARLSVSVPGEATIKRCRPSRLYEYLVPGVPAGYAVAAIQLHRLDDPTRNWDLLGLLLADTTAEELAFRGLPLALALASGVPPLLPVAAGTLLWAVMHDTWEIPGNLLTGALFAWLWLVGAWLLAIGLHLGGNTFGHLLGRINRLVETDRDPESTRSDSLH